MFGYTYSHNIFSTIICCLDVTSREKEKQRGGEGGEGGVVVLLVVVLVIRVTSSTFSIIHPPGITYSLHTCTVLMCSERIQP